MRHRAQLIALASLTAMLAVPAAAVDLRASVRQAAVNELAARAAQVAMDPATGSPRLVRISPGSLKLEGAEPKSRVLSFFERFGEAFGIADPGRDLVLMESAEDRLGMTHLRNHQCQVRSSAVRIVEMCQARHFDIFAGARAVPMLQH